MRSIYATIFLLLLAAMSVAAEPARHPVIAAQANAEGAAAILVREDTPDGVMEIADVLAAKMHSGGQIWSISR